MKPSQFDNVIDQIVDQIQTLYRPKGLRKSRRLGSGQLDNLRASISTIIRASLPLIVGQTETHRYASIHKRSNYYSDGKRYEPSQTYVVHVTNAYEGMIWLGYIKEEKKGVSEKAKGKYLTRYSATKKLLKLFGDIDLELLPVLMPSRQLEEPLIVKVKRELEGENDTPIKVSEQVYYEDTPVTLTMRDNLKRINDNFSKHWVDIALDDKEIHQIRRHLAKTKTDKNDVPETLNLGKRFLHRSFLNTRFNSGGRFYGGWWQIIPKLFRSHIVIDGKKTIELDFSGLHPSLLYGIVDSPLPEDPYDIGIHRDHRDIVKRAFNAMLNAAKPLKRAPKGLKIRQTGLQWRELSHRLLRLHTPINIFFHQEVGNRLQFIDSLIAERIMLRFINEKAGAVVLPVHDSFIVHHGYEYELRNMMIQEFEKLFGQEIGLGKLAQKYFPLSDRPNEEWQSMEFESIVGQNDMGWINRTEWHLNHTY